jgi:type II secretory pathway pseudopilin PulG
MVELLLVITVLGIVTAIAVPNMNTAIRQRRVIAASSALASDVEAAYSLAARQRRPVRLTFHSSTGEVRVADRASGTVYRRRPLRMSSEYHLDGVTMAPPVVDVFPTGISSAAFSLRLTNGSFQRHILVARTGLTRVIVP